MAVDRGNKKVAGLYSSYNPTVLRLIYQVAQAAKAQNIPCGICGESGADLLLTIFFVGSGVTELSMTGTSILKVRSMVRSISYADVHDKVAEAMRTLASTQEVLEFLSIL
jgi:phosphoenolpyruvate-protein kinase (PTS system EI component)